MQRAIVLVAFACIGFSASAFAESRAGSLSDYKILAIRSDENYQHYVAPDNANFLQSLKKIDIDSDSYLSIGGELRFRLEDYQQPNFALRGAEDFTTAQMRALLHADWHLNSTVRVFGQLSAAAENGRKPGPRASDRSAIDVAQLFVDIGVGETDATPDWRLRLGRQEIAFGRFVTLRDGTNLRRTFDGLRLTGALNSANIDLIAAGLTQQNAGAFDDQVDDSDHIAGLSMAKPINNSSTLTGSWFWRENERALFASGRGIERRHTFALRTQGRKQRWDWDAQLGVQSGRFIQASAAKRVRAWGFASELAYTYADVNGKPRVALRLDGASGDNNPADNRLGTFDLAYPNLTYLSDAAVFAPRNLLGLQPFVSFSPSRQLNMTLGIDFLWRWQRADAIYAPSGQVIFASGHGGRHVATQPYLRAQYAIAHGVDLAASLVHVQPGSSYKASGAQSELFFAVQFSTRF
jgi:hypothetical protein